MSTNQSRHLVGAASGPGKPYPGRKILFASSHSIVDFSNGVSVATFDVLQGLVPLGFDCQAFCTSKLDFRGEVQLEQFIADLHDPYRVEPSVCGNEHAQVLYTRRGRVPITVIRLASSLHSEQSREEVGAVLAFFRKFLDTFAPDVMVTHGGDPITHGMIHLAKRRRIPVVFMIHNFAYTKAEGFANVDYCLVASEFARRHYEQRVGVACQALPYPIDWERVRVENSAPQFVTFVNPSLEKGVYAFARIADELGRRRPDIPLLVVESRGTSETLLACGLDLVAHGTIQVMPHTTDPRKFWAATKIALMPSLWWENQPLVAIEAMINGIPVIGSDRGGIPETLGQSGFVLPLPERLTPASHILPWAEEVEPWVETIIRLWDGGDLYREQSTQARAEAERWRPERVRPLYVQFFREVRLQDRPPILARVSNDHGGRAKGNAVLTPSGFETTQQDIGVVRFSSPDGYRPVVLLGSGAVAGEPMLTDGALPRTRDLVAADSTSGSS
jgi:glycosyltransferase involved in cell wall biosynthesis